jgi:alpha-tubulin suppressor-like RCC1 family protein
MASLSAYFSYDTNTMDRGIPYAQFTAFQYNTGGNAWYTPPINRPTNALLGTGRNTWGQLGLGNNDDKTTFIPLTGNWSQVICGDGCTMALSAGTTRLFVVGFNGQSRLGTGNLTNLNTFSGVPGNWSQVVCGGGGSNAHTMAISAGTTKLFGWGDNNFRQCGSGAGSRSTYTVCNGDWSQVACGAVNTMALAAGTNDLYGVGDNALGQLGLGPTAQINTFTALTGNWSQVVCRGYQTMALSAGTNTKWFATGYNQYGGLGLGLDSSTFINTFTALTGNWSQIACGLYHTMALSAGTTKLFGTGYNAYGQLGLGTSVDCNTFTALTGNWSQVICGFYYTMALSAGTTKWFGTGSNAFYGQLGLSDKVDRKTFTQLPGNWSQMACGSDHTMALPMRSSLTPPLVVDNFENQPMVFKMRPITDSGAIGSEASFTYVPPLVLYGTGKNDFGQLGLGNYNTDKLTFNALLTGNWSQIACGGSHNMALSAGTTIWYGTGDNGDGELGLGSTGGDRTTFTQLTGNWGQIICGSRHTMALSAGTTQCFGTGYNFYGQLGLGNRGTGTERNTFTQLTGNWSQIACGGRHTMALSAGTGALFATGYGFQGQLGTGNSGADAERNRFVPLTGNWSQVVCGYDYTLALSAGTTQWFGTGDNGFGQLGLGDTVQRTTFTQLTGNWSQIACATYHTMALSAGTNALFATGYNSNGQLGLGDTVQRTTFTQLTGNWSQMSCNVNGAMALSANTTRLFGAGSNFTGYLGLGTTITLYNTFTALTGNWTQVTCGGTFTRAFGY